MPVNFTPDWDALTAYAYRCLRRHASTVHPLEDMVQDYLMNAHLIYERRKGDAEFNQIFLRREAYYRVLDITRKLYGRKGQRVPMLCARSFDAIEDAEQDRFDYLAGDPGNMLERSAMREKIRYILSCLPHATRLVLLLKHFEQSKGADLIRTLGVCEARVCQKARDAQRRAMCAEAMYEGGDMDAAEAQIKDTVESLPLHRQYKLILHLSHTILNGAKLPANQRHLLESLEMKLFAAMEQ